MEQVMRPPPPHTSGDKNTLKSPPMSPRGLRKYLLFFLLLLSLSALSGEKNENEKDIEQIFSLEREFYVEPFRTLHMTMRKK